MIIGATYGLLGQNLRIFEDVLLEIENGKIVRVIIGGDKSRADIFYDEAVLVPGFINMHTHVGDSIAREKAYGMSIFEAVARSDSVKFSVLSEAPPEVLVGAMITALKEMVSRGITTFFDFREGGVEGVSLLRDAVSETYINCYIMGRPDKSSVEEVLEVADGLGLSSLNKYSNDELVSMFKKAKERRKYIAFHGSETQDQRERSMEKFGTTDIMRALKLFPNFDYVVHLTYAERQELSLLVKEGVLLVFCPRANMYLGLQPPPIADAIELGAMFAFGTDNVMLNSPDIFREFDMAVRLARIQGATPDPHLFLAAATSMPSRVLSLKTGIIEEEYQADFFIFDLTKPNVAFVDDIYRAIVLRGSEMNIVQTYVSGKPVLEYGEGNQL